MRATCWGLGAAVLCATLAGSASAGGTLFYWAADDAFVYDGAPSTNYADSDFLHLGGALDDSGPGLGVKRAYVQMGPGWQWPHAPGPQIPSPHDMTYFQMQLRDLSEIAAESPVEMWAVDAPFDMDTLTWDNQPTASTFVTSFFLTPGAPFIQRTYVGLPNMSEAGWINAFHNGFLLKFADESLEDSARIVAVGSYKNPEILIQQYTTPEPGAWGLGLLAAGALVMLARRKAA